MTTKKHSFTRRIPQFKIRPRNHHALSDWEGDNLQDHPQPHLTRFLLQNCHGLPLMNDTNYFKSLITGVLVHDVHYMAFPEINANCVNKELVNGYKDAFSNIVSDGVFLATNATVFHKDHRYQPGGVASGFFGKLVTRYMKQGRDKYGRWHFQEFHGKFKNLRIYTLYRTNYHTDNNAGHITSWAQQRLLLQKNGISNNPRNQVIEDFSKELEDAIGSGFSIIVLTDLNEHVDGSEGTNDRFRDIGLINLFQERLGDNLPPTFHKGSKAIDHVYLTPNIDPYIIKAGMAPFGFGLKSDHRALIFDLDLGGLLDPNINIVQPYHRRRLKATVPKRMEKYLKELDTKWTEHKIDERLERIENMLAKNEDKTQLKKALNDLDAMITGLMKHAERKCAKTGHHHTLPWSPDLHYALLHIRDCAHELKESLYIDPSKTNSQQISAYQEAEKALGEAKANYQDVKKEAQKHRDDFMNEKVEYHHNKTGKAPKSILKSLQHIEIQQQNSVKIGSALGKNNRRGITSISIPAKEEYCEELRENYKDIQVMWERIERKSGKDITRWEQIVDRQEIETLLVQWQQQHFRQAGETPLSTQQWRRQLIEEETQKQLLNGTHTIDHDLPDECKEILEFMQSPEPIRDKVNHTTSLHEFKTFIKNAKEKSACSPSGRTYSHYKTLLDGETYLDTIHRIFSLALDNDIILDRWTNTITTLIPKDEGKVLIHRLRAIHVVEAELQFFSKVIYAKRMVGLAEKHQAITDEQFGGRKNRRAQSVVLNKILYYSITHQKRMPAAFLDNDAKACYDRIIPSLACLETRKWGLTHKATNLTRQIMESQKFSVKTAHGISHQTYQYQEDDQIYGAGQGLGWSGAIWMASSNTICDIIKAKCAGMRFESPNRLVKVEKRGDLFVDDTALGVTMNCVRPQLRLVSQLQNDAQKHASTLFSEGHKLSLPKCSWYLVDFTRDGLTHRHCMIHELDGELVLEPGYGIPPEKVKRLEPFSAHRTLGNYICVDGRQNAQLRFLKSKVKNWVLRIKSSGLSGSNRLLAYNGYLIPSLTYRLATSSLTFKQCKELQSTIDPIILHAYGIQKNLPKIVLFSTTRKAGLGVQHIYHLQGIAKLKLFLMHMRRTDSTGNLLQIALDNIQLELGISSFSMSTNYYKYQHHLTKNWVTHLWQYLSDCKATLHATNYDTYKAPREGDQFFMDIIYASHLDHEKKEIINQIRISLQILTLADIVAVGSSTNILPAIRQAIQIRDSKWEWPRVLEYPSSWIDLWKSAINDIIEPALQNKPLGQWNNQSHQRWPYRSNSQGTIISSTTGTYEKLTTTRISKFIPTSINEECNFRADVHECNDVPILHSHEQTIPSNNFTVTHEEIPTWMSRNWGVTPTESQLQAISECLREKRLVGVADGSVNAKRAGQAWTLVNGRTEETILTGVAHVDGTGTEQCSTRAELFGLLACLTCVEYAAKKYNVTEGFVELFTDSKGSISKSINKKPTSTKDVLKLDNDVACEVNERVKNVPFQVKILHVKGHQDDDRDFEELPLPAQLNCMMDSKVNTFMRQFPTQNEVYPILPKQKFILRINGIISPNLAEHKLIEAYNEDAWKDHITKRLEIPESAMNKVDWIPLGNTIQKSKTRGAIVKTLHKELNTMQRCKQWKTSTTSTCPLCYKRKETWNHILQCKNEHARRVRRDQISTISDTLKKLQTDNAIYHLFMHILRTWTNKQEPEEPEPLPDAQLNDDLQQLFHTQRAMGWNSFMQGILCNQWGELQQKMYQKENKDQSKYNGDRWMSKMVSMLLNLNRAMWKNRCDIVHILDEETLDKRKRQQLRKKWEKLKKQPWRLRATNRHLLDHDSEFFDNINKQALNMWEQRLFVALEQALELTLSNDIRQYGTIQRNTTVPKEVLAIRPIQTVKKYGQLRFNKKSLRKHTNPSRIILTADLETEQREIEKQLKKTKTSPAIPRRNEIHYTQNHIRDYLDIHNNLTQGHRCMTRSSRVRVTRKINNKL